MELSRRLKATAMGASAALMLGTTVAWGASPDDGRDIEVVHQFRAIHHGASRPFGDLLQASDGNLYGATSNGGRLDVGTIFRIQPDGTYDTMVQFGIDDGAGPVGDLVQGADHSLYGVTTTGGDFNRGVVFSITTDGSFSTLYSFTDGYGGQPNGGLTIGVDGGFYGVLPASAPGYIYRVDRDGHFSILSTFDEQTYVACDTPTGGLVGDPEGNFYGVSDRCLFAVTPAGRVRVLYQFQYGTVRTVSAGVDGNLYVTTSYDGTACASLQRFTPAGKHALVHEWPCHPFDPQPNSRVVQGPDGALHGALYRDSNHKTLKSLLYRIDPDGTYSETLVPNAAGRSVSGLTRATDGWYYGTATLGGHDGGGTVLRTRGGD